jgi:hypothetical protein
MDTTQEVAAALSTDLDAVGAEIQEVKKKLMKTIKEKAILEARLRGDPMLLLSVKTRRRAVTGNTRSREASGTAGGPWSLGQRPSNLARTLAWSR